MKKTSSLLCSLLLAATTFGQFSDDFEGYTAGTYLGDAGASWTTWDFAPSQAADDVQITTSDAHSGANSIYFYSESAGGGPADVLLPFGQEYSGGTFTFTTWCKVEANRGAYFNFQALTTPGDQWSMDCYMINNGDFILSNNTDGAFLTTSYPIATWFEIEIVGNLLTTDWELFLDGISQGTFNNTVGTIASLDLYPVHPTNQGGNDTASYWIDDVSWSYVAPTLPALDLAINTVSLNGGIEGDDRIAQVTVRNLGSDAITSFDVSVEYDGNTVTENVTGINIASLDYYTVNFTNPITLGATGDATATISNVNTGTDLEPTNDVMIAVVNTVIPAQGRVVLGEEGTGTWCGWCPRGAVMMDHMSETYPTRWAGIAVHNGDPMVDADYDGTLTADYISGFPSSIVDRGVSMNPSDMETEFMNRVIIAPTGTIEVGAEYGAAGNVLKVSLTTTFEQAASGDWRIACALTENNVTGTSAGGYDQSNYYSGGGAGEMGGYEALGNPVPAVDMTYNHVARVISPSFYGNANSFGTTVSSGQVFTHNFYFDLDPTWNINEMHIIGMLLAPDATVDNAGTASIAEAELAGHTNGEMVGITSVLSGPDAEVIMYPNPTREFANVKITTTGEQNVSINIMDYKGAILASKNHGSLDGSFVLPINTSRYAQGNYMVEVSIGDSKILRRLVVK